MRDCVFFVADKTMRETFFGFLGRADRSTQLLCGHFEFDPAEDLFYAAGQNDPGVCTRAGELLRPFLHSHQRAVIALDCDWEGSPGHQAIVERVSALMVEAGWLADRFVVIAIDPELENWIWQDSPVLDSELRHPGPQGLRAALGERGLWPPELTKPPRPKELLLQIQEENRVKKSSSVFRRIAAAVGVGGCVDAEFQKLRQKLAAWFPTEAAT